MGFLSRIFTPELNAYGGGSEEPKSKINVKNIFNGIFTKLFESKRLDILKKVDEELNEDINNLKEHVINFNTKIRLVDDFLNFNKKLDFEKIKSELSNIENILNKEYDEDKNEDKYIIKALKTIEKSLNKESDHKIKEEEIELKNELINIKKDIENLQPVLIRQIHFLKLPTDEQLKNIKAFLTDIKEEANIIGYEESIVKDIKSKIDKLEIETILTNET